MDYVSANTSRHSPNSSELKKMNLQRSQNSILCENDDIKERENRRKSRANLQVISAPKTVSNKQLRDIYSECIRLSAENKINKNNAFGLQLIDYMQEVLLEIRDEGAWAEGAGPSFTIASSALDASVKIYGHRVDSVHVDTTRIAGCLGHSSNKPEDFETSTNENNELNVHIVNDDENSPKKKKKVKARMLASKIETNLNNIENDTDKGDFNIWNGVFARRPISEHFGRGGPESYIINQYGVSNDFGRIIIDPFDQPLDSTKTNEDIEVSIPSNIAPNIENFNCLGNLDSFSFNNWNFESKTYSNKNFLQILLKCNDNTIEEDVGNQSQYRPFFDDEESEINDEPPNIPDFDAPIDNIPISQNPDENLRHLATVPNDYSYFGGKPPFTPEDISTKYLDFLKRPCSKSIFDKKLPSKGKKIKIEDDFSIILNKDEKKRIKTSLKTRRSNFSIVKPDNILLTTKDPVDDINVDYIFLLFINQKSYFRTQEKEGKCNSFNFGANGDANPANNSESNNFDDFQDIDMPNDNILNESDHLVNSLVQAPPQVDRIFVKYSKVAKRVDTKEVKTSMWKLLETNKTKTLSEENNSFMTIHKKLIDTLPKTLSSNLSPQLSFVCLLHLANEKKLKLTNSSSYNNIDILYD